MSTDARILTADEKSLIISLYNEQLLSCREIGRRINRHGTSIQRFLRQEGYDVKATGYNRRRLYNVDEHYFEDGFSEKAAYWAGFIAADGCIYKSKRAHKQDRLIINIQHSDVDHLRKFDIGYPVKDFSRGSVGVDIPSNKICNDLRKYGIHPNKSCNMELVRDPQFSLNHFIRGYFDGNGCAANYRYMQASMEGARPFIESISRVLPCKSALYYRKDTCTVTLKISQRREEMDKFTSFLYDDATIFLERKAQVLNMIQL